MGGFIPLRPFAPIHAEPDMPHTLSRRKALGLAAASALTLATTGCGFRLRGSFTAPFETLYLQMRANTPFASNLKRAIEAGSSVRVVDAPEKAEAVLELLTFTRERDVLSVNIAGRAREYELTLTLEFRITGPDGFEYVEATSLSGVRDITYSETEFLSREKEEEVLYTDIENDLIAQIVRRIEAARRP